MIPGSEKRERKEKARFKHHMVSAVSWNTSSKEKLVSVGTCCVTVSMTISLWIQWLYIRRGFPALHIHLNGLHVQISLLSGTKRSVWIPEPAVQSTDQHTGNSSAIQGFDSPLLTYSTLYVQTITNTKISHDATAAAMLLWVGEGNLWPKRCCDVARMKAVPLYMTAS